MKYLYRSRSLPSDDHMDGPRLVLMSNVIEHLRRGLPKKVSGMDHENVAYLGGFVLDQVTIACAVIFPKAETGPKHYETDIESHAAVTLSLVYVEYQVVAQIHSHPGEAVYHSDDDDELAFIKGEGFWSIVVPYYCKNGVEPVSQCGFHLFTNGEFHLLTPNAAASRVTIQNDSIDLR